MTPADREALLAAMPALAPLDAHNETLLRNVHPPDWVNPEPAPRYNLVVIGGGTAGLVTAAGAAGLGARVALVERHLLGGDCLNVGCVPSKALLRSARAAADVRAAGAYGVRVGEPEVDFGAVMERMRALRAGISPHDSAARFRDLGVDVFQGEARFTDRKTVEVAGRRLRFARAVIATGARAAALPIPGLAEAGFLTNETVFSLTARPSRLAVIGAGPVGCELAQAFARFGSQVTLIEIAPRILTSEDPDATRLVHEALVADGVEIVTGSTGLAVERDADETILRFSVAGESRVVKAGAVLLGAGRSPNVEGLGLEAAGVAFDPKAGVTVDHRLRTTNRRIFAAGDVAAGVPKLTHAADATARIVIQNALFLGRARASALTVPRVIYTDPELAHVGLTPHDATERGIAIQSFGDDFAKLDRAILDGEGGLAKIHVMKGSDEIVGATIVARHAGEMISEVTLAMTGGLGLGRIGKTIHAYPTQAEAIKRAADAWSRTRLTPFVAKLFRRWLAFRR